jgi:hypothetical protein
MLVSAEMSSRCASRCRKSVSDMRTRIPSRQSQSHDPGRRELLSGAPAGPSSVIGAHGLVYPVSRKNTTPQSRPAHRGNVLELARSLAGQEKVLFSPRSVEVYLCLKPFPTHGTMVERALTGYLCTYYAAPAEGAARQETARRRSSFSVPNRGLTGLKRARGSLGPRLYAPWLRMSLVAKVAFPIRGGFR